MESHPVAGLSAPLVFDIDSVRAVDRQAIQAYGIPGIVLMENAARGLANEAIKMLGDGGASSSLVFIFCGSGNNGGDGYAAARLLHNSGVQVVIVPLGSPRPESDAGVNDEICRRMGLKRIEFGAVNEFAQRSHINLIIDAIYGTGLDRNVTGTAADAINWINASGSPVLAADVPSGLHCDRGEILGVAVRATRTVTFVGWKKGFLRPDAQKMLGEVIVADIGAPRELVERYGQPMKQPPDSSR